VKAERIPAFLTHYYEAERGPFKNVCDLTEEEIDHLISVEKDAETGFNRFALGRDFFKIRRAADDLLIERYRGKFGFSPLGRPFYAVLGEFDRTLSMYRLGRSIRLDMSWCSREQVTFMYPDHFVLVWSKGLYPPNYIYIINKLLLTIALAVAGSGGLITSAQAQDHHHGAWYWGGCYYNGPYCGGYYDDCWDHDGSCWYHYRHNDRDHDYRR
jgi:hypothetical protein